MRILGIDPGSRKTGIGVIDVQGNQLRHVHHQVIRPDGSDLHQRLCALFHEAQAVIHRYQPDRIAMEEVFVAKNAASALKLGQARGVLLAACASAGLVPAGYSATTIKQSVCSHGKADKAQVQYMINMLLRPPGTLAEDAADALAVCLCHAHHHGGAFPE